jgi:hypothetical protein
MNHFLIDSLSYYNDDLVDEVSSSTFENYTKGLDRISSLLAKGVRRSFFYGKTVTGGLYEK